MQCIWRNQRLRSYTCSTCVVNRRANDRHGVASGISHAFGPEAYRTQANASLGLSSEQIVNYADEINADLILMPTRGRGALSQLFFGSTTMEVLRNTSRPIWTIRSRSLRAPSPLRCRRMVCGVELGAAGQMVLDYSARLAHAWQVELVIVHVVPGISDAMLMLYGLDETGEIELLPETARHKVDRMAAGLAVPYQVDVRIGDVAECLHAAAKQHSADLLIVGRGKRTNRWRLGANIGDILARSGTPVISCVANCRRPRRIGQGLQAHAFLRWRSTVFPLLTSREHGHRRRSQNTAERRLACWFDIGNATGIEIMADPGRNTLHSAACGRMARVFTVPGRLWSGSASYRTRHRTELVLAKASSARTIRHRLLWRASHAGSSHPW